MNNYDFTWEYGQSVFNMHFFFKTDRELITNWKAGQTDYYCSVECTGGNGTIGDRVMSVQSSIFSVMAKANNDNPNVYGEYFRQNLNDYWFRQMGIDPNSSAPMGVISDPSDKCYINGNTIAYPDNSYVITVNGHSESGTYNTTQGWATPCMLIDALLQDLVWSFTGVQGTLDLDIIIDTNIPIWDTYNHMRAFIDHGSTEGLLNGYVAPSMNNIGRYYMNNLTSNNGNIGQIREEYYYRWDGSDKCLGLASDDGKTATLYEFNGGPGVIYKSEDRGTSYEVVQSAPTEYYCDTDLTIPRYVITFKTNIPFFVGDSTDSGFEKLKSYITGDESSGGRHYTADDAVNRSMLDDVDIFGKIGDLVNQTTNGTSSISYTYGVQMFDLTATQKATFLRDVLSQAKVNDLLDNTKLFGTNQIGALQSLRYFPIDVSEVCSEGSASSCQIGSYTYEFSSSVNQILQNNKMINMGEQFFRSPYENGDFRNVEPWCKLYCLLPYAGVHELVISRYINKRVGIKLAVDVTTGACEYHLYASGLEMDSFQGQMGTQIPLTANDKASQVSAVQNGILTSVSGLAQSASDTQQTIGAAGSMITGGMDTGKALTSGGPFTPGINALNSGVTIAQGAQTAIRNFLNAPIQTKGASAGNLGDFGVNSPYFIFAWANSIAPANELNLVGKPSNQGGKVGQFAGYLKCSAFRLANGFTGTAAEAAQIAAQMMEGVYI